MLTNGRVRRSLRGKHHTLVFLSQRGDNLRFAVVTLAVCLAASHLAVGSGTLRFNLSSATLVGSGVTASVSPGATLELAGLVTAEPGERRRVRYRLQSTPMQLAQQFLAALARDWDGHLQALAAHLDRPAARRATTPRLV